MEPLNCMTKSEEPVAEPASTNQGSLDLEFPDWSGMDDSHARITPEAAFRLCENYPRWISNSQSRRRPEEPEKCLVEFIL